MRLLKQRCRGGGTATWCAAQLDLARQLHFLASQASSLSQLLVLRLRVQVDQDHFYQPQLPDLRLLLLLAVDLTRLYPTRSTCSSPKPLPLVRSPFTISCWNLVQLL